MDSSCCTKNLLAVAAALNFFLAAGCENPAAMNASTANVKHITPGEFAEEVTRCTQPVVVDFYATWCVPCRQLTALLDGVAGGYTNKIKFVKINVDESPALADTFHVQGIPTVLLFKDGKVSDSITGLPMEAELKGKLDTLVTAK